MREAEGQLDEQRDIGKVEYGCAREGIGMIKVLEDRKEERVSHLDQSNESANRHAMGSSSKAKG